MLFLFTCTLVVKESHSMTFLTKQLHVPVGTFSYGKELHDSAVACTVYKVAMRLSSITDIWRRHFSTHKQHGKHTYYKGLEHD